MKKLSVNSPEYRDLVSKLLGKEVKFEDLPAVPIPKSPVTSKTLPPLSSTSPRSPPKRKAIQKPKKSVPKKVAKKPRRKSKYYISENTFDKISKDFYGYFKKEFDWRNSVKYIEVHIENMFRIREVWFYLTFVFREGLSEEEMGFIKDQLMSSDYGYANRDIKKGDLEKVSSDLVLGFFDPELLQTLDDNDIKIMAPLYMKGKKSQFNMYELEPNTYLSPTLNDDT